MIDMFPKEPQIGPPTIRFPIIKNLGCMVEIVSKRVWGGAIEQKFRYGGYKRLRFYQMFPRRTYLVPGYDTLQLPRLSLFKNDRSSYLFSLFLSN